MKLDKGIKICFSDYIIALFLYCLTSFSLLSCISLNHSLVSLEVISIYLDSLPDPPVLEGTSKVNNHLLQAEKLFEGKMVGPETIVYQQGSSH